MKLASKTDLDVPAGFVYDLLSDHAAWESDALARGVQIERPADMPLAGIGAGWRLQFVFRGRTRKVLLTVKDMQPDQLLSYGFEGTSLEGGAVVEIMALSPRRTRLRVALTVRPRTLAARLFLNTLLLARRRVQSRFDKRLRQLGDLIRTRYAERKA